jgi:hypothetical protein
VQRLELAQEMPADLAAVSCLVGSSLNFGLQGR